MAPDNANYTSKDIATEFLEAFGQHFSSTLKEEISHSKYVSIMADEATDIRVRQELSLCCRYVNSSGCAKEAFLGLVHLESTTAEVLTQQIIQILKAYNVSSNQIQWQAYDGAANFSGRKNGVQANMKIHFPDARYIHCRSHLLNLAAVGAAKNFPMLKKLYSSLNSLWRFFHLSPKRTGKLEAVQQALGSAPISLVQAGDTRWTSNYKAVKAVIATLSASIVALEDIHQSGDDLSSEAGGLLLTFHDINFLLLLYAVREILNPLHILALQLQSQSLSLAELPKKVTATVESLQKIQNDERTYMEPANVFIEECTSLGLGLIGTPDEQLHAAVIKPYIAKLITHLGQRLQSDALNFLSMAYSIFQPTNFQPTMTYGEPEIRLISTEFSLNLEDCLMEWKVYRNYLKQNMEETTSTILQKLASKCDLSDGFPLLHNIACLFLSAPLGTASVERSF